MARQIDGLALGLAAAGGLFAYAGLKGISVPHAIQAMITGHSPASAGQANPVSGTSAAAAAGSASLPASGSYSNGQLQSLWVMAGGNPAKAAVAACIAMAESSGNPNATSANPDGGTNVGLWQLDTPGGKGAGYSVAQLKNPLTNAQVAVAGSGNGTNWSAWATAGQCGA